MGADVIIGGRTGDLRLCIGRYLRSFRKTLHITQAGPECASSAASLTAPKSVIGTITKDDVKVTAMAFSAAHRISGRTCDMADQPVL
ncbi:hypothetical protein [Enterocloster sp.]|uniref:hypothetical protein n=1 Tax=Enterocloster sp. TaxID=2719315 RepID=UPI00399F0166